MSQSYLSPHILVVVNSHNAKTMIENLQAYQLQFLLLKFVTTYLGMLYIYNF